MEDFELEMLVESLSESCKGMSKQELLDEARNEHVWALGSTTNEETYMHEQNATAYRILAEETEE